MDPAHLGFMIDEQNETQPTPDGASRGRGFALLIVFGLVGTVVLAWITFGGVTVAQAEGEFKDRLFVEYPDAQPDWGTLNCYESTGTDTNGVDDHYDTWFCKVEEKDSAENPRRFTIVFFDDGGDLHSDGIVTFSIA